MKKATASILIFIYFLVSTGFTVNMHYCMDKIYSWEIGAGDEDSCEKCGMTASKSSGCCRDEVKTLKLKQDFSPATSVVYNFALPAVIASASQLFIVHNNVVSDVKGYSSHSPPLPAKQDTYLLNCVFRI